MFDLIGGFKSISLTEDIEIKKSLRKKKSKKLKGYVLTSGRISKKYGTTKQLLIDVLLVLFYKLYIPPNRLKPFW